MWPVLLVSPLLGLQLSGCDPQCGRRLAFVTQVTDETSAPIVGAAVEVTCLDVDQGTRLAGSGATDAGGSAAPAVHARNRSCPADPVPHAGYFGSCVVSVGASGFERRTVELTGSDLDSLPSADVGAAGHGVRLDLTLPRS